MVIKRCVTEFFKLAMFRVKCVKGDFTVRAPNCCCDDKHHKTSLKTPNQRNVSVFCKITTVWIGMGLTENSTVRNPKCRLHEQHHKSRRKLSINGE